MVLRTIDSRGQIMYSESPSNINFQLIAHFQDFTMKKISLWLKISTQKITTADVLTPMQLKWYNYDGTDHNV
jgi:hypothetical protein